MKKPDSYMAETPRVSEAERCLSGRHRISLVFLMSALSLGSCKEDDVKGGEAVVAASSGAVSSGAGAAASEIPDDVTELLDNRGTFVQNFSNQMELESDSVGFFFPLGYQQDLKKAMLEVGGHEGSTQTVSKAEFTRVRDSVLAVGAARLSNEWAALDLDAYGIDRFKSTYHRDIYRYYYFLRYLEMEGESADFCETKKLDDTVDCRMALNQEAWKTVQDSPYYGVPAGPKKPGPYDAPFQEQMTRLIETMTAKMPSEKSDFYSPSFEAGFRTAVLDMYMPAMMMEAIRDQAGRSGVSMEDLGIDESAYWTTVGKGYAERAGAFLTSGRRYYGMKYHQRAFKEVGQRFKSMSDVEDLAAYFDAQRGNAERRRTK